MAASVVVEKLVRARRRRRRDSFLGGLADDRSEREDHDVLRRLDSEGRYADYSEWRIGTVTEELIVRTAGSWSVSSRCDLALSVTVAGIPEALAARGVFARLHPSLFYGLGWPSWAAYMQMDPPAGPWDRRSDELDPYLRVLADEARIRFAGETDAIRSDAEGGGWRESAPASSARIDWDPEASLPYRGTVECGGLNVAWRSPTIERALQFVGILESLAEDLVTHFDWH
jgi:hypothetical protein